MKSFGNILLILTAVSLLIGGYFFFRGGQQVRELPYFEPIEKGAAGLKDSLGRHLVSDFSLIDQNGDSIHRSDFSNSVTVVDFFFTRCQGICPKMTTQMQRVYKKFNGNKGVKIISHTVNPENDSVPVLREYANHYKADAGQWHFVTGDKVQLYNLARKSYLISDTEGNGGKEDFVHSQNFALIDHEGHIRGVYDGTDTVEVNRLIVEINVLLGAYK